MHPVAFRLGSFTVLSYSLAILVAILAGVALAWWRAPGLGLERRHVQDGGLLLAVSGFLGARILFALTHRERYESVADWLRILDPRAAVRGEGGGMAVLGGILLAIAACFVYARIVGARFLPYGDLAAPSIALGQGIGRLGCFLAGCCHGGVCDLLWAVRFPSGSAAFAAFDGAAVHPTQLYDAAFGLTHCCVLLVLARRASLPPGALFALWFVFAGSFRIWLDTLRVYRPSEIWAVGSVSLTAYQAIGGALVVTGLLLLRSCFHRAHRDRGNAAPSGT